MPKFTINLHGEEFQIEVARQGDTLRLTRGDDAAELRLLHSEGATFVFERINPDGTRQRSRAAGHVDGDRRQIWVNGRTFTYERVRQRATGGPARGALSASIPAVVAQVLVAPGDHVTAGEKLILLESMKMVIPIQAPYDGTVKAVHCAAGESVEAGVPLISLVQEEES